MTDCTSAWRSADGEREALLRERLVQLLVDLAAQLGLGDPLVVEERAQLVDHELVHLLAHVFELRARAAFAPCAARCSCHRAAGCWVCVTTSPSSWLTCRARDPSSVRRRRAEQRLGDAARAPATPATSARRPRPGRPAFTDIGTAMSSGIGKFGAEAEHPLDLLHVELHLARSRG